MAAEALPWRTLASAVGQHREGLHCVVVKSVKFWEGPGSNPCANVHQWVRDIISLRPQAYHPGMTILPTSVARCKNEPGLWAWGFWRMIT